MAKNTSDQLVEAPSEADQFAQPVAVPNANPTPAERVANLVHDWFTEHVQNTPIAHEQRAYAQALAAKDALSRMILERLF